MSTKTTFKRVALVAVAALGFGMLSVVPSSAALTAPVAAVFIPASTAVGAATNTAAFNYTVVQYAGAANFVTFNGTTNVAADANDLFGVRAVVTGGTIRSGKAATGTCNNGGATLAVQPISSTYAAGVWGPDSTGTTTRLLTSDITNANCVATYGNTYTTFTASSNANFTVGTATAGTITAQIFGDVVTGGSVTSTLLQTFTIVVLPVGSGAFTSAKTLKAPGDNSSAYYNLYEGFYASKTTEVSSVADLTVRQYSGGTTIANAAELKGVTATLTGVGTLVAGIVGASYLSFIPGAVVQNQPVSVYSDGRAGLGTLTISVNGALNSTTKIWFYGAPATITAAAVLANGRASTSARTTGSLTFINNEALIPCVLGTEDACNETANFTGIPTAPVEPGDLSNVAVAVIVKDANGTPVPTAVTGSSSNSSVVSDARSNWLLDSGMGDYSAGTYYQHITYGTPPNSVSGSTATLTYSILNADGTIITSNPVTITLGGAASTITMTTDKSSYAPGDAGVITITAKDSSGNASYDGAGLFTKVVASTSLFGGSIPTTSASTTAGVKTYKFFAPPVSGKFTITATLADLSTLTATVTVDSDPQLAAAVDAAAEATDAANAATDAANAAAEAADAATAAAQDAADAVAALSAQVATMMAQLKAQLTALTNLIIKIQKKLKA